MLGHFDGRPYTVAAMTDDLKTIWQQLHKDTVGRELSDHVPGLDRRAVVSSTRYRSPEWIDHYVPGGLTSRLGQLLDIAYNIEYGAETSAQSSLNMLYLLGYVGQASSGRSASRTRSSTSAAATTSSSRGMARSSAARSRTGTSSSDCVSRAEARYTLTFRVGSGAKTVTADHVVLALPFSILRSVDTSKAGFTAVKAKAIRELGMGTNSKLHLQFKQRFWGDLGSNGETYSDRGYQTTWEVSRAQGGTSGILVDYTGGTIGASFGSGTATSRAKTFLAQIEPVLPGATAQWNGRAALDYWTGQPVDEGLLLVLEGRPVHGVRGRRRRGSGNCHFAGEHTSQDSQGYLNGAVETGERAAAEILADLK